MARTKFAKSQRERKNSLTIAEIIRNRHHKAVLNQESLNLLIRIIGLLIIGWLIFTHLFFIDRISGNQMYPAIKDGDLVVGFRLQKDYQPEDIVCYLHKGKKYYGRVLAREGDYLRFDEQGNVLVNGTVQAGDIFFPTSPRPDQVTEINLNANQYYLLGDYRTQTLDSRDFGPIAQEHIQGKVITLFRRRGL